MTDDEPTNERDLFGNAPDPMTPGEWAIIVAMLIGALSIIGGLAYLCLVIIRG